MAITATYGPTGRYPDVARGEYQYARILGDGTEVICDGAGTLKSAFIAIAGTSAKLYDARAGDTPSDTNIIANLSNTVTGFRYEGPVAFTRGLTIVTVGATSDIAISFLGRQTVSPLTFP